MAYRGKRTEQATNEEVRHGEEALALALVRLGHFGVRREGVSEADEVLKKTRTGPLFL